MKIIEQSAKLIQPPWSTDAMSVYKYIERIGRICYKSEDKITDASAIDFIRMLKSRTHTAMLEHYIFNVHIPHFICSAIAKIYKRVDANNFRTAMKYIQLTRFTQYPQDLAILSGNATAFNNLLKSLTSLPADDHEQTWEINLVLSVIGLLYDRYPELIDEPSRWDPDAYIYEKLQILSTEDLSYYENKFKRFHQLDDAMALNSRCRWRTGHFVTNRGISHELVRHRPCSFAQESTRYCNYSKDKFNNEITVIKPLFEDQEKYQIWLDQMTSSEKTYFDLLAKGAKPQEARGVLPTDLKTELIITTNIAEWNHIFKLRTADDAHPQVRALMKDFQNQLTGAPIDQVN